MSWQRAALFSLAAALALGVIAYTFYFRPAIEQERVRVTLFRYCYEVRQGNLVTGCNEWSQEVHAVYQQQVLRCSNPENDINTAFIRCMTEAGITPPDA